MTHDTCVLAMDAGQTGIRSRLLYGDRTKPRAVEPPAVEPREFPGVFTDRPVLPQLAAVAMESLSGQPAHESQQVTLAIGSSGLTDDMTAQALLELLADSPISTVHLAHDSITSSLGALGDVTGAVVAAGTGVVTLAVGDSEVSRVDGWGHLLGDAGSGYWIGRAALEAVMRAHDGRGPATSLTAPAQAEFADLEGAYMVLQGDENKVSRVAAWARVVDEHAEAGDEVCRQVLLRAGQELAISVAAGLANVGQASRPRVATLGKVFGSATVRQSFTDELDARLGSFELTAAHSTGLDGAAVLPTVTTTSALATRIRTAGKA